jgi:hypothetical protein
MAIELTDDGTLDTVLRCTDCGAELRYNYDGPSEIEAGNVDDAMSALAAADAEYDAFVEWAIDDATAEHACTSDSEPTEPQEDDLTTRDHRTFYQNGKAAFALIECTDGSFRLAKQGQLLARDTFPTVESAVRAYMELTNYHTDCWFISDHGNAHLMDLAK